jgi:hypothetical protein
MPSERKISSNPRVNLVVAVADEEADRLLALCQLHQQVARLPAHPALMRIRRDAAEVDPSAGELDEEQHVQTPQAESLDRQETACDDRRRLRTQELRPARRCPVGCLNLDSGREQGNLSIIRLPFLLE